MLGQVPEQRRLVTGTAIMFARYALIACALVACSEQPAVDTQSAAGKLSVELPMLEPVNFQQWQEIRVGASPDIVVVDLWATWCVPCLERFPHMVQLSKQFANRGVTFVSLSLDDRDDADALSFGKEFLTRQQAGFAHYLLNEELLDGFEKLDLQTVPAVDIYARDGSLHVRFTGDNPNKPFDEEDIDKTLAALLARE